MASPASSQTSQVSLPSQFLAQTFSNPVAIKLDEENYLPWKQHAEATIEGYDLMKYIAGENIPLRFASNEDQENGVINIEYQNWKKQDSLLKSWLLASMSTPFTTRMVGCEFSHQIWKRLEVFFASQIKAKVIENQAKSHKERRFC